MAMERAAMRAYVTGADHMMYTALADGMVQLNATHSNLKQFVMELRLDMHSSIAEVKRKLLTHNGTSVEHMELYLQDETGATIVFMGDDSKPLGFYGPKNGWTIHVVDTDPFSLSRDGGLDDVSKIAKYRMSDEEYDRRENTLRAYKRKMLAENPNFRFVPKPASAPDVDYTKEECIEGIEVGKRCEVNPGARRGEVCFVGMVPSLAGEGYWVGVRLDEPLARGDGSRGGIKYFDAAPGYGSFVRPTYVTVGDFPEVGIDDLLGESGDAATTAATTHDCAGCCATESKDAGAADAPAAEAAPVVAAPAPAPAPAARVAVSLSKTAARAGRRRGADSDDDDDDEL